MVSRVLQSAGRLLGALLTIGSGAFAPIGSSCLAAGDAGEWQTLAGPQGLRPAGAAYDAVRHRVIFASTIQGYVGIERGVWTLSTLDAPTWTLLHGQPWPAGSGGGSIVFDPVRDRLLLFGGDDIDGVSSSDTWELSLANPSGWNLLQTTTSTRPPSRSAHAAIYDPVGDRMIVFGGYHTYYDVYHNEQGYYVSDTWTLSLSGSLEWQLLSDSSPARGPAVHDPVRNRMVVYGGDGGVWALALSGAAAWSQLANGGPGPRSSSALVYDGNQDRVLVFGGWSATRIENDVWSLPLSGGPWTQLSIAGASPAPRVAALCAFDPANDRLVLHGGVHNVHPPAEFSDSWSLALSGTPAWTKISDPLPRSGATAVLDETRSRMIVFGGSDPYPYTTTLKDDLWTYSLASDAWQRIDAGAGPSARTDHAALFDPGRDRMWLFGGFGSAYQNDLWSLAPSGEGLAWAPVDAGPAPEPRAAHTLVYDPRRDRALLFGGRAVSGRLNDVWELRLSGTPAWSRIEPSGTPPAARYDHTAIYDPNGDRMIVFAGMGVSDLQDVWTLELANGPRWVPLGVGYVRPGGSQHTAILDPVQNRMVTFGGNSYDDVWELSLLGPATWTQLEPTGVAQGASQHAAIYDPTGDRMLALGESFQALQWSREHLAEAPRPEAGLALHGVRPNPIRAGGGTVSLTLPDAAPARLELIDVAGRALLAQDVGHLGAGRHDVSLGSRNLAPGVFWLRLTRAGRSIASKIVVTR